MFLINYIEILKKIQSEFSDSLSILVIHLLSSGVGCWWLVVAKVDS